MFCDCPKHNQQLRIKCSNTHYEGHVTFTARYPFCMFWNTTWVSSDSTEPRISIHHSLTASHLFPNRPSDWMFISGLKMHSVHLWKTCPFLGIPLKHWGWKPQRFLATEQWTFTQSLKSHHRWIFSPSQFQYIFIIALEIFYPCF